MTNRTIFKLLLVMLPAFSGFAMQTPKESIEKSEKIDFRDYQLIAGVAIRIHQQFGCPEMLKFIKAKFDSLMPKAKPSELPAFLNKVCKVITREKGRIDIFMDELLSYYFELGSKEMAKNFFNQFCPKLQFHLLISILGRFNQENSDKSFWNAWEVIAAIELISYLIDSSRNIILTCKLVTCLEHYKTQLIKSYFDKHYIMKEATGNELIYNANLFKELVTCPMYQIFRKLYVQLSNLALKQNIHSENQERIPSESCWILETEEEGILSKLFSEKSSLLFEIARNLSHDTRKKLCQHLFVNTFVDYPKYLTSPGYISQKLSLIYDNDLTPLTSLGFHRLDKRINDLMDVVRFIKNVRPKAFELSKGIGNPSLLGPKAKSIWFLNDHITKCFAEKITQNLILNQEQRIDNDLKFLLKYLGSIFLQKALVIIQKNLIDRRSPIDFMDILSNIKF